MQSDQAETGPRIGDIDGLFRPTHDEYARQRFVSALRKHAVIDMREDMRLVYETEKRPYFKDQGPRDAREVQQAMKDEPSYRFYSAIRYNAQEMVWLSVQAPVERALPQMIEVARDAAARNPAGGSLRLNPDLKIPRYVSAQDVHLIPGCFHSEFIADDVAQGAVLAAGNRVFTGAIPHRKENPGGVGRSVSHWLKHKFPDFKPRRMLDLGTSSGKNLLPYLDVYPDVEAYGVDVSAPLLRYGMRAPSMAGRAVHFSQQNAEALDFPDGYFDLIVSSFFFHEVPVMATQRILAGSRRVLAKDGIMAHMELPPTAWPIHG